MGSVASRAMLSQRKGGTLPRRWVRRRPAATREPSTSTVGLARKLAGWRDAPQAAHKSKHDLFSAVQHCNRTAHDFLRCITAARDMPAAPLLPQGRIDGATVECVLSLV